MGQDEDSNMSALEHPQLYVPMWAFTAESEIHGEASSIVSTFAVPLPCSASRLARTSDWLRRVGR
jgi:hypothetical protein